MIGTYVMKESISQKLQSDPLHTPNECISGSINLFEIIERNNSIKSNDNILVLFMLALKRYYPVGIECNKKIKKCTKVVQQKQNLQTTGRFKIRNFAHL